MKQQQSLPDSQAGAPLTLQQVIDLGAADMARVDECIRHSLDSGVVLIEQSILYRYETDEDQRDVEVSFVEDTRSRRFTYQTEKPDRDFLQIAVGATLILQNGLQLSLGYRGISSHRFLNSDGVEFGFRKEF